MKSSLNLRIFNYNFEDQNDGIWPLGEKNNFIDTIHAFLISENVQLAQKSESAKMQVKKLFET